MASGRAKQSNMSDSGVLVGHAWDTLDLAAFKVIWCTCDFPECNSRTLLLLHL